MTLPELVIFDFAGTCLRDDGAVLVAYRQALSSHDIPFSEAELAAGANLGASWVVGVLSRGHGPETMGPTRHTHLLPSVASLPALFGG